MRKDPEMFMRQGVSCHQQGRLHEAVDWYEKAVQADSQMASALFNLGNVWWDLGKLEKAIDCFQRLVRERPNDPDAHYNLGILYFRQKRPDPAITSFERCLRIRPDFAAGYYNLGNAYHEKGDYADARDAYLAALKQQPDWPDAYNNLGNVEKALGNAVGAIGNFEKALQLAPKDPMILFNLGGAHGENRNFEKAIDCYTAALDVKPDFFEAWHKLGTAYKDMGLPDNARACYDKALSFGMDSGIEIKSALLLPVICESRASIAKSRNDMLEKLDALAEKPLQLVDPYRQVGTTNFFLVYHGLDDREIQEKTAKRLLQACPELAWTAPHVPDGWDGQRKIRVGVISKYLHDHTIGKLNLGMIRNLDRETFTVILFRFPGIEDPFARELNQAADRVVRLPDELAGARQAIAACEPDILFYLDIGMIPLTYFLAYARLAPVQCVTWGHPVTTGIPNMDYFISCQTAEPPGADAHYSETLVRLKQLGTYYYRPENPGEPVPRDSLDLPAEANIYLCAQTLFKFHPDFDDILAGILLQDPKAVLVFIQSGPDQWRNLIEQRFASVIQERMDRVRFVPPMPREKFFSLLLMADVLLDTPHFCGGNTSIEAFALGLPVVTLPGDYLRGRLTLAMYRRMGIMECVARDPADYTRIAVKLGTNCAWRNKIKKKIEDRAASLFEDIDVVGELERFWKTALSEASDRRSTQAIVNIRKSGIT